MTGTEAAGVIAGTEVARPIARMETARVTRVTRLPHGAPRSARAVRGATRADCFARRAGVGGTLDGLGARRETHHAPGRGIA